MICFAGRSVRFADMPPSAPREKSKKKRIVKKKKAITPLQAMMLRMAGTVSPSVCTQHHYHTSAGLDDADE